MEETNPTDHKWSVFGEPVKATAFVSPWNLYSLHKTIRSRNTRNPGVNLTAILKEICMSPRPLNRVVNLKTIDQNTTLEVYVKVENIP